MTNSRVQIPRWLKVHLLACAGGFGSVLLVCAVLVACAVRSPGAIFPACFGALLLGYALISAIGHAR